MELAILLPVFLVLCLGIFDMAHLGYMKQVVSDASWEAARYGIRFQADGSGVRIAPSAYATSISSWVTSNYAGLLPADANITTYPSGTGFSNPASNNDLTIRITATKTWWVIGSLIPGLGSNIQVEASTTMKMD